MATYNYELTAVGDSVKFSSFRDHMVETENQNFILRQDSTEDLINLSVFDPLTDQHAVTKSKLDQLKSKTVLLKKATVTDTSPVQILAWELPATGALIGVKANVSQAFNGPNASVRIVSNTETDLIWDTNIVDLNTLGVYSTTEFYTQDSTLIPAPDPWIRIKYDGDGSTEGIVEIIFEYIINDIVEQ